MSEPTKEYLREHHAAQDRASVHKHSERASTPDRWRDDDEYAQVEDSTNDGVAFVDTVPQHTHEATTTKIGPYVMGCRACDQNRAYIRRIKIEGIRREIEGGDLDPHLSQLETSILFRRSQLHCGDL